MLNRDLLARVNTTTAVVVGGTILVAVVWWSTRRRKKLPPGPRAYPIVGNLPLFVKYPKQGYKLFCELAAEYGPVCTVWMAGHQAVILSELDVVRECLVDKADVFTGRPNWQWPIRKANYTEGLLWQNGEGWKNLRAFLARAFKGFGVGKKSIEEKCLEEALVLCEEFKKYEGKPFNPKEVMMISVSNVICSIVYGERFEYKDKKFQELMKLMSYTFEELQAVDPSGLFDFMQYLPATAKAKKTKIVIDKFLEFGRQMIAEHRKTYDPNNIRDMIDLFIKTNQEDNDKLKISDWTMELTVSDLFCTGTDTTSTALYWQLLYLIAHPEIQQKCHEEIDRVLGREQAPTFADRVKLPYVQATMLEILRISNIAAIGLPHNAEVDSTLGGYDIPRNTIIMVNVYGIQMSEKYWEKPREFRPERWLEEDGQTLKKHPAFILFGLGPRKCLGEELTKVEQFFYLTTMLQRFRFEKEDDDIDAVLEGELGISLSPLPYKMRAILR